VFNPERCQLALECAACVAVAMIVFICWEAWIQSYQNTPEE